MSILDIMPDDCPVDLRARIEKVMAASKISWTEALLLLARKVIPPASN